MMSAAAAPTGSVLASTKVFAALPQVERERLAGRCVIRKVQRGEALIRGASDVGTVWLVLEGLFTVSSAFNHDEPTLLDIMKPGALIGALVEDDESYAVFDVRALTPGRVAAVPRGEMRRVVRNNMEAAHAVIEILVERLKDCARLRALAHCRSRQRVARVLVWLTRKVGPTIPVTRRLIADAAGVSRETVVRILAPLEREGWLRTHRGVVTIVNERQLERRT